MLGDEIHHGGTWVFHFRGCYNVRIMFFPIERDLWVRDHLADDIIMALPGLKYVG